MKTFYSFVFGAAVCGFLTAVNPAAAQGTLFTYQGRLNDGTNPANGAYNLTFSLFNVSGGGSPIAGPVTNNGVSVTNGLFTVQIDFGPGVFTGQTNWLQIGVRTNGGGSFSPLSPRQELTPTPYAVYAENANAAGLSTGTVPDSVLNPDVALLDRSPQTFTGVNTFSGPGEGFIINTGPISTSIFSGLGLQYNGSTGEGAIMSSFNDGFSSLTFFTKQGSGSPPARQMIINRYGVVGIDQQDANNGILGGGSTSGAGLSFGSSGGEGIASKRSSGGNQYGLDFYTSSTREMSIDQYGAVSIDPQNANGGFINNGTTNGASLSFGIGSGEGLASQRQPTGGNNRYGLDFYTDFAHRMSITQGGLVGINVGTNAPNTQLEVNGNMRTDGDALFLSHADGSVFANDGLYYDMTGVAAGINNNSGPFLAGYFGGALGGLNPNETSLSWDASGNVWVNGNLSTSSLTVRGGSNPIITSSGNSLTVNSGYLVVDGLTPVNAYIGDDGAGHDVQIGSQLSGITAVSCFNTADQAYMHLYCSSVTIKGGSDLAEPFEISTTDRKVPEGAVLVIDEANPGHLKLSSEPYDTRVAGVVSGANGINPGIQMQQEGLLEEGQNVALTGRVYVQADTSNGAIKPGDLLTTSSAPGRAMKVSNHLKAQGAILGKAMTGLKNGQGMVLVLVTLQ